MTQSVARANRPVYSSSASSYPVGQCTWGAKTLAPWAGDYWGNGAQWAASAQLLDSVLVANHKLELLHVGMTVDMDT